MRDKHRNRALRRLFAALIVYLAATSVHADTDNALHKKEIPATVSDGYVGAIDDISTTNEASISDRSTLLDLTSTAAAERRSSVEGSTTRQQKERFDSNQDCTAAEEKFFIPDRQMWIINDEDVSEGGMLYTKDGDEVTTELDKVTRCLKENAVLYFNTTITLTPRDVMEIDKNTVIAAYMESDAYPEREDLLNYDGDKVVFTCANKNTGIFEITKANVTIANIKIQRCRLYGASVIALTNREEGNPFSVQMLNVDLEDSVLEKDSAIMIDEYDYVNLQLENVKFQNNSCTNSEVVLVNINIAKEFKATHIEALENSCTVMKLEAVANFNLSHSVFSGNRLPTSGKKWNGSVLRLDSSTATVTNVTFVNNEAENGGAVYLSSNSHFTGDNVVSKNNTAEKDGGAVYVASGRITLIKSEWKENNASGNGGAVYVASGNITWTESDWEKNNAIENGGALYLHSGTVNMDKPTMNINIAEENGGAIYVYSGNLSARSLVMEDNSAAVNGGAFYLKSGTVTLSEVSCRKNNATEYGGAFYLASGDVSMEDMGMENNHANKGDGGVFYVVSSNVILTDFYCNSNSAGRSGGVFYLESGDVVLDLPTMTSNRAEKEGGALYIASGEVALSRVDLRDNNAGGNGGALYLQSGNISLKPLSSRQSSVREDMYPMTNRENQLDSTLSDNSAGGDGGAFYVASGNVSCAQSKWISNKAKRNGGAFYLKSGAATLTDLDLHSNQADADGGAFFVALCAAKMRRLSLSNNIAGGDGGAFSVPSDKKTLAESKANEGEAKETNDDVDAAGGDLEWFDCTFTENMAARGGVIFINSPSTKRQFLLKDSAFLSNRATLGGAIYQSQDGENEKKCSDSTEVCTALKLANVEFSKNEAEDYGAIAFVEDPLRTFYSCDKESSLSDLKSLEAEATRTETAGTTLLCPNWVDNVAKAEGLKSQEFSSLFHTILVEVWNENVTTIKQREKADDTLDVIHLEPQMRGSMFPRIILKQLDVFGNELGRLWSRKISAKIVLGNGKLKGYGSEMMAHTVDDVTAFESVLFDAQPGLLELTIEYDINSNAPSKKILLDMKIRDCPDNEAVDEVLFVCRGCDSVHYESNGECLPCPKGAECNGRFPIPVAGKWHRTPCQTRIRNCLTEDACKYTGRSENLEAFVKNLPSCEVETNDVETYDAIQCDKGHKSPLCGSCEDEYGTWTRWMCFKCRHEVIEVLLFLATLAWMGLLAYVQIWRHSPTRLYRRTADDIRRGTSTASGQHSTSVDIVETKAETTSPLLDPSPSGDVVASTVEGTEEQQNHVHAFAELIKILMNYLQLSIVLISLRVKWVPTVRTIFELAATLGGVTLLSTSFTMDCVLTRSGSSARPLVRLIAAIVVPLIVCGCLIAVRAVLNKFTHRYFRSLSTFVLLTLSIVFYISYLGITKLAVSAFYCVSVFDSLDASSDKRTLVLADDTSVECYTGVHWAMVVIAALVLLSVSIGFPLLSFIYIRHHVKTDAGATQKSTVFEVFGFMFWSFESQYYYWELFVFLKKAFLASLSVFSYSLSGSAQQVIAGLCLTLFLCAHTLCLPYRKGPINLNAFETSSLLLTTLNVYLAMVFGDERPMDSARFLCTVGAVCLHAVYALTVFVHGFKLWYTACYQKT